MIRIAEADVEDAREFLTLEAKCFSMRFSSNTLYYWRPIVDYCWAFKAVDRHRIVGGVIAMPTRDDRVYVNSLFVDSGYRRSGIGSRLLARVLELKPSRGFVLDVKTEGSFLQEFYERRGFKRAHVARDYYRDGTTRIIMERE